jgi:HEAT repeat protein
MTGLSRTFELLSETANEAAVECLLAALDSRQPEIQGQALRALLVRRSLVGQREILRRWGALDAARRQIVAERPGWLHEGLREALLGGDAARCQTACEVILYVKDYDLMPVLITAAEDQSNPLAGQAARTLRSLAERLYDELAAPRDYRNRRDPQLVRAHMLTALEGSVARFDKHRRAEALDAFLLLANHENATLNRILLNPHDKSYLPLVDALTSSIRPGVMRLLLAYLDDAHAPHAALGALAHRTDEAFLAHLMAKLGSEPSAAAKSNLKRVETFPWLRENFERLMHFSDAEQRASVTLAMHSGMNRLLVFELIRFLLRHGNTGGRQAAAAALAEFNGADANRLALEALDDYDPQVQASVVPQLRDRGIPGAISRLLELLESPHDAVREAAQHALYEFSFRRFLGAFDLLSEEARVSTGTLVRKVDAEAAVQLREELSAPGRSRRVRAMQMTVCLGLAQEMESALVERLSDEDAWIRAEAAHMLTGATSIEARQGLRLAMLDRDPSVQSAAEGSLRAMALLSGPSPLLVGVAR